MKALAEQIVDIDGVETYGRVVSMRGLMVEVAGPIHAMSVGARLTIETGAAKIPCEVVGFSGGHALAMPFAALDGVRRGCRAVVTTAAGTIRPSERWLGRVVNARAEPIDGQGPLPPGPAPYPYRASPPPAHSRRRVGDPLDLGGARPEHVHHGMPGPTYGHLFWLGRRQIGSLVDAGPQRLSRHFGDRACRERGREVQEFLQDDLAPPAFVVVSTSDEPALMRRQAAYLTLAIAEYFRDLGKDVLVLMDSVTPLRDGAARDRTLCRRTADRQGLYPDRICGIAAPAGAGRARHRAGDRSRAFSACSSMVMITTSRSLTPSGAFSMVISSWNGRSPSVADIRRSTSSSRSRERCRGRPIQTTCRQSTGRVR